ncbi:hypothetical protein KEM55_005726, partial [Ascosphaera atra]
MSGPKKPPSKGTGLKEPPRPSTPPPQQDEYTKAAADSVMSGFPKSPSQFDQDYRVSYSQMDGKWILEADDGSEYHWDSDLRRWVVSVDDELLEQQRQAYKVEGVDENADTIESIKQKRKRKQPQSEEQQKQKKQRVNSAVYVTNLPHDVTVEEVSDVFSKCGVIAEEIDRGRPRIKLYTDDQGNFKGDALVVYFRPESVNLAVQMLDETEFRFGDRESGKMSVQPADFSFKATKEEPQRRNEGERRKIQQKTQRMRNKLADWDDDDPQTIVTKQQSRWDKVVILKHMFTLKEIDEDPAAILDIKEDIRDECSKIGDVTNVVLYDKEQDGVVSVRFSDPDAARMCVT